MDYKSKYKDLMEKVEAVKKDPRIGLKKGTYYNGYVQTGIRDALEYITTDESEDERIRKAISVAICGTTAETVLEANGVKLVDALAYLEKQKDEAQKQFNLGMQAGREEVLYEMEKEQKHIQDKEEREYIRTLKSLISDFLRGKNEIDRGYYQKIYDWLDGRHIEQKPAKKDEIGYDLGREKGMDAGIEYVLNHLELYGLCKPAEWSEEDERILTGIIERGSSQVPFGEPALRGEQMEWLMNRLKSLRPQPHWKPSDKQMHYLLAVINEPNNAGSESCHLVLKGLYEDLKKLM